MREVRTCDFCGADATGVYEPLPSSMVPDGPRMLLCDGCRDRLGTVIDPLLDHLDADGAGIGADSDDTRSGSATDSAVTLRSDDGPSSSSNTGDGTAAGGSGSSGPGSTRSPGSAAGGTDDVEVTPGGRSPSKRSTVPKGYRKVMRFLENRELPMPREEAETLAAGAYDLDEGGVSDAIDHAIKHDRLTEIPGEDGGMDIKQK